MSGTILVIVIKKVNKLDKNSYGIYIPPGKIMLSITGKKKKKLRGFGIWKLVINIGGQRINN